MLDRLFGRKSPEVLVVGGGPVGLFGALALARRGVAVEVVDQEWRAGAHSYALALHPGSLRLLDEAGLLEAALERAYRVHTVALYDGAERRAALDLGALAEPYPFVAVTRQDVLEELLAEGLRRHGVRPLWSHKAAQVIPEDDHVTVAVDQLSKESMGYSVAHTEWIVEKSRRSEVAFVVGADGHRSYVRRALDLAFEPLGGTRHFAVFEFETDADLGHEMRVAFTDGLANVLWPLPEGRARWSFELADYEAPAASRTKDRFAVQLGPEPYPVLSEERLRRFVAERAPWFDAGIGEVAWRIVVRFERRLAEAFGRGRVWLAGDAAHMTGPVGIQSMNVGLREARDLADDLAAVLRDEAPLDSLRRYAQDRRAEWQALLGLDGAVQAEPEAEPWVRAHADALLACIPASGDALVALMRQLRLRLSPHDVFSDSH